MLRRQIGVEELHLGAVHHHVRDRNLGEFEQATEHIPFGALDFAFLVEDVDRAHQLLVAADARIPLGQRQPEKAQHATHQRLDRADDRTEYRYEEKDERRDQERHPVRIGDGDRFRRHLAEDDNQGGHDDGRGQDAVVAVELEQNAGGDRR